MGKLIIVSGENNSGKSIFAESLVAKLGEKRYYIATMKPSTAENCERIKKHKKQRENLNFTTLELPYDIGGAVSDLEAIVLLEDVSNLLANNVFEKSRGVSEVCSDILNLAKKVRIVVAVTISGLKKGEYDAQTNSYIGSLNKTNEKLKKEALVCITLTDGKPTYEKGETHDIY